MSGGQILDKVPFFFSEMTILSEYFFHSAYCDANTRLF